MTTKNRREKLLIGYVLLSYILDTAPTLPMLRTYVLATKGFSDISLPAVVQFFPSLLRLLDPVNKNGVLAKHLFAVSVVADCYPSGYRSYYYYNEHSVLIVGIGLMLTLFAEFILLPIRLLFQFRR